MIKTSTSKKFTENQSIKKEKNNSPSNETINALLNFSKSLSVSQSTIMKQMMVVTN